MATSCCIYMLHCDLIKLMSLMRLISLSCRTSYIYTESCFIQVKFINAIHKAFADCIIKHDLFVLAD